MSPRPTLIGRLLGLAALALFLGACALGFLARKTPATGIVYTVWADRDLARAAAVPREFPTSGAELTRGSRTPGGFFYLYLWLQLLVSRDALVLHRLMVASNLLALALLAATAWRLAGRWASLCAATLFAASPAQLDLLRFVGYNPSYPILFAAAAYWFFAEILARGRTGQLPWLVAAVCAASQMHLSFLLLLPAFLIAFRWHGRRFSRRSRYLAWGVAVLFYGPFFVGEALTGWPLLQELLRYQGLVANSPWVYSFGSTTTAREIDTGLRNLSYTLFGTATGPNPGSTAELFLTGVTVAAFLGTAIWALRSRPSLRSPDEAHLVVRRLLLVMALGVALMSLGSSTFTARYIQFLLPAAILVMATGTARLVGWVTQRQDFLAWGAAAALVAWGAGAVYVNTVGWVRLRSRPAMTLPQWRDLMAHLQGQLGFAAADVPLRTAILLHGSTGWTPLSVETAGASFLAESYLPAGTGQRKADCALVLIAPEGPLRSEFWDELPPAIGGVTLLDHRRSDLSMARAVIAYHLPSGNCLTNIGNRYALTPEEMALLALAAPEATFARVVAPLAGGTRYQVRLLGRNQRRRPLDLLLDLDTAGGAAQATVHSNSLRGYDGITSYHLTRPRLVVRKVTGGPEHTVPIVEGLLGGWFNPIRTPWRSAATAVPPGGPYRVELAWDDVQFQEYGGNEGPGSLVVAEDVVVR